MEGITLCQRQHKKLGEISQVGVKVSKEKAKPVSNPSKTLKKKKRLKKQEGKYTNIQFNALLVIGELFSPSSLVLPLVYYVCTTVPLCVHSSHYW